MTKREFIIQYVMNRALGNTGGLDPKGAAQSAAQAWDEINRLAPIATFPPVIDNNAAKRQAST